MVAGKKNIINKEPKRESKKPRKEIAIRILQCGDRKNFSNSAMRISREPVLNVVKCLKTS
jgi:hypothetical protein